MEVGQIHAVGKSRKGPGDASPEARDRVGGEIAQEPLGDDRQANRRIEAPGDLAEAAGSLVEEGVDLDDAMVLAERARLLERLPLAGGHGRQIGLDVGDPVAVTPGEAPAPR